MIQIENYVGEYLREWVYTKRYAPKDEALRQQGLEWAFYPGNKQGVLCDPRLSTPEEWRGPIAFYDLEKQTISYYEGKQTGLTHISSEVDIGYVIAYIEWHVRNHYQYPAEKGLTSINKLQEVQQDTLQKFEKQKEIAGKIEKYNPYLQDVLYEEDGCMKSDTVTLPSEMAQEIMFLLQEYRETMDIRGR